MRLLSRDGLSLTAGVPADEKVWNSNQLRRPRSASHQTLPRGSARSPRAELRRFLLIARFTLGTGHAALARAQVGLVEHRADPGARMYKVFGLLNGLMKSPGSKGLVVLPTRWSVPQQLTFTFHVYLPPRSLQMTPTDIVSASTNTSSASTPRSVPWPLPAAIAGAGCSWSRRA